MSYHHKIKEKAMRAERVKGQNTLKHVAWVLCTVSDSV